MVIEELCNGSGSDTVRKENGFGGNGSSSGSHGASLRTYKRRKCTLNSAAKVIDLEKLSSTPDVVMASASSDEKMVKNVVHLDLQRRSSEQVCDPKMNCHSLLNGSDDCSYKHWRNALECICESLRPAEGESGGIQISVTEALKNSYTGQAKMAQLQEIVDHRNGESDKHSNVMFNAGSTAAEGLSAVTSNGSSNESNHSTVSRLCETAFSKVLMSGKFALLCKLLSENFHGLKIDKLLDFSLINARMKDGAYERRPTLFSSDVQQLWGKLNSIGKEMVSLSNNLSEVSRAFCHELGGGTEPDTSSGRRHEVFARDCKLRIKQEDPDSSGLCTCRQCGERSDERECLVCDSCEAMFHVSCIEPAVKEIPYKSWYCATCTSTGVGSPHEDCLVCDRLNASSGIHGGVDTVAMFEETLDDVEESSDGIIETGPQVFKGNKCLPCKACGDNLHDGEEFLVCEHRFCQFKYYHIRCLSSKEIKLYGPRWYCPSCLCRACLTDKDDDDIVMCDGCDHGYHIYCMNPPRSSIPRGKWFCPKCDAGIKAIRKVKKYVEDVERMNKKNEGGRGPDDSSEKPKSDFVDAIGESGGMDMLLTAARTLNEEEDLDVEDDKS